MRRALVILAFGLSCVSGLASAEIHITSFNISSGTTFAAGTIPTFSWSYSVVPNPPLFDYQFQDGLFILFHGNDPRTGVVWVGQTPSLTYPEVPLSFQPIPGLDGIFSTPGIYDMTFSVDMNFRASLLDNGEVRFFPEVGRDAYAFTMTVTEAGSVTPIPEPETYAMLLAGLGLLGVAVRRKNTRTPRSIPV